MASPRTRRLKIDYELLSKRFADWPVIRLSATAGLPPEHYRFTYSLKGLYVSATGEILGTGLTRPGDKPVTRLSPASSAVPDVDTRFSS